MIERFVRGSTALGSVCFIAAALWQSAAGATTKVAVSEEHVREVHRRAIVVDTHADTLWRVLDKGDDIVSSDGKGQVDLPRLLAGGVDGQFFSIWPQPLYGPSGWVKRSLRLIDALHGVVARSGGRMFLATSAADIRRADREGRVAALVGIEGGQAIEDDLGVLRMFYRAGVRYMTLTWSINTSWADSSGDKRVSHGLTGFGEQVVREMNRLGMLVDVSHVSDETFADVLRVTSAPVIASHSSCRAICDAKRNMTDDMLRALAKNGGVVMINYFSAFIDQDFAKAADKAEDGAKETISRIATETLGDPVARENRMWEMYTQLDGAIPPPSIERVLDHIEHVMRVAGPDHVGLGSDFDGITSAPKGLEDVSKLPAITRGLLERGHSDEEVIQVLGGNFLRVFESAEKIAATAPAR
ncbi:MAG: membrane dipeptidase [Acidobacteria bacterium]|nr:membrane dipeptidase [Acidobacteriota bacterium]